MMRIGTGFRANPPFSIHFHPIMRTLQTALLLFFPLFSLAQSVQIDPAAAVFTINEAYARTHIERLASDEMKGRGASTSGGRMAADYIVEQLKGYGLQPFINDSPRRPFFAVRANDLKQSRYQVHPDSIARLMSLPDFQTLTMQNILFAIPGRNKEEYVFVGAHYDHLGVNHTLPDDSIYNGADDNASGVSAVLQIARAFALSGYQPERTIVFAFWDGEELGLLGSRSFLQSFTACERIKGYINFDMIGGNHYPDCPEHLVYFYTAAREDFGHWLKEDISRYNLALSPDYRPWDCPDGGSDNAGFARLGIPVIWYHTDGHPFYHQPGDEASHINYPKVEAISRAAYLAASRLANETSEQ